MKGILWYVTRKLEGIFDGILMEFRKRISEDGVVGICVSGFPYIMLHHAYLASYSTSSLVGVEP